MDNVETLKQKIEDLELSIEEDRIKHKKELDRIKTETSITNIKLVELSKTNYRVLLGPFNDIYSLKESFEKMNSLYFENLEILKNV